MQFFKTNSMKGIWQQMEEFKRTPQDVIKGSIEDLFHPKERKITIRTGRGGFHLFNCCLETEVTGCVRYYIGWKLPRIITKRKSIKWDDYKENYYKLVKK